MGRRLRAGLCFLFSGVASACVSPRRPATPPPPPPAIVDEAAQKSAYEAGLRSFAREQYVEARTAWREAVRLGPRAPLGRKAQEHLRKLDQMLLTLQEIQLDAAR